MLDCTGKTTSMLNHSPLTCARSFCAPLYLNTCLAPNLVVSLLAKESHLVQPRRPYSNGPCFHLFGVFVVQESFWLGETLKYFYLIFAPRNTVNLEDFLARNCLQTLSANYIYGPSQVFTVVKTIQNWQSRCKVDNFCRLSWYSCSNCDKKSTGC